MEKLVDESKSLIKRLCIFFSIIYAVQGLSQGGASGLFSLPLSFMLKEKMNFGPEQLAYFQGLVMIPWAIKPLYGLLSDFLPIFGWRRKSYFILAAGLASFSALYLAMFCNFAYSQLLFFLTATALGIAFCDVLCDAIMVEKGKPLDMVDKFQAIQWRAISFSSIISGLGGGLIAKYLTYQQTFLLMAFLPSLIFIASIFFVPEKRYQYRKTSDLKSERKEKGTIQAKDVLKVAVVNFIIVPLLLWTNSIFLELPVLRFILLCLPFLILLSLVYLFRAVLNKKILFCMAFLFWWDFSLYISNAPFFFYQTDTLGFSKMFMGTLSTIGSISGFFGAWLFAKTSNKRLAYKNRVFADLSFEKMLWYSLFIGVASILSSFLLIGMKSAIVLSIVFGFIFMFAHLTILVLAAKLCPPKIEGTFFALLMSVVNLGASVSSYASGAIYKFLHSIAPTDFSTNLPAKVMVWLGWPKFWIEQPEKSADFAQYYAVFWLLVLSVFLFSFYFLVMRRFGNSIKEGKETEIIDISKKFSRK